MAGAQAPMPIPLSMSAPSINHRPLPAPIMASPIIDSASINDPNMPMVRSPNLNTRYPAIGPTMAKVSGRAMEISPTWVVLYCRTSWSRSGVRMKPPM